ncbi:TPA: head DNA stabilization protein [Escherichia coli]|nr:head DNA stabilization protein [Escherichia coli]
MAKAEEDGKTKGDLVLKALRKAGLYSNATLTDADPQAIEDAINDLEDMMAAWQAKGIELGYQFADTENGIMPLPDDDSGIPAWANDGVALKLAVQVCMDNVIQPSDALLTAADSAYQTICIALTKIPPLERRNDMPLGSGNKSAFTWNRFYIEKDDPST